MWQVYAMAGRKGTSIGEHQLGKQDANHEHGNMTGSAAPCMDISAIRSQLQAFGLAGKDLDVYLRPWCISAWPAHQCQPQSDPGHHHLAAATKPSGYAGPTLKQSTGGPPTQWSSFWESRPVATKPLTLTSSWARGPRGTYSHADVVWSSVSTSRAQWC